MAKGPRSRRTTGMGRVRFSIALAVAAPLITFAAILLVRGGIIPLDVGLDVLTLRIAIVVAFAALGFAIISMAGSLSQFRRLGLISLAVLLVSAAVAGLFTWQARALSVAGPLDVSTDLSEPPAITGAEGRPETCRDFQAVMTQVAPAQATEALQSAGFSVTESQLFRARGVRDGFWFGLNHEAVIRIRPGRTDIRVVARYDRKDGGETCRIARQIMTDLLQAGT